MKRTLIPAVLALVAAVLALAVPARAAADTFVPPPLTNHAAAFPNEVDSIIVLGQPGTTTAQITTAVRALGGHVKSQYSVISGVSADIVASKIATLGQNGAIRSIT